MSEERLNPVLSGDPSGTPPSDPGPAPPASPTPRLVGGRPRPWSALHKPKPEPAFTPEQQHFIVDA